MAISESKMSKFKSDILRVLDERGFIHQISDEAGLDNLFRTETVSAYIGFDPTASSLHAGGLIQIMKEREMAVPTTVFARYI